MYFITTKRMLEVCFSAHPNIQYRTKNNGNTAPVRIRWYSVRQVPFCRLLLNRPGKVY